MYSFPKLGSSKQSTKRHYTLPIFDSQESLIDIKVPIHKSEADELKYVKTVLENHGVLNAFEGLSVIFSETKHKSVHNEIFGFILKCLDNPLDITECMKGNSKLPHSFSSDFDLLVANINKPRKIRQSSSMTQFILNENSDETTENNVEDDDDDESEDDNKFLIELLNILPKMIPKLTKNEAAKILIKIPYIFVALAPDPQVLNVKGIPKFVYFKAATQCATSILKLKNCANVIDQSDISQLAKMIIMASFTCSSNIGDIVRMTKSKASSFFSYIGECLPFIAALLPIIEKKDNGLILLLQQFWVSIVVQTCGDMSVFTKFTRELHSIVEFMPPLVSGKNSIDFDTLSAYVQDILAKLKINLYPKRNEDFAAAFCKIASNVPIKTVLALKMPDIALLLSIAVLEKLRASQGNFVPMFGYFGADFYPEFSLCLDSIAFPIFLAFQTHISTLSSVDSIRSKVLPILSQVFFHYTGKNPRILSFIDKITQPFVLSHPLSICAFKTMESYILAFLELKREKSPRLDSLKEIGRQMFQTSAELAPNALNAVLHNLLQKENVNLFYPQTTYLSVIMELYPSNLLLNFTHQLSMKQKAVGMVNFLSHRQISKIENLEDRLLLLAFHLPGCGNKTVINDLIANASPNLLMLIWSHIAIGPEYKNQEFVNALTKKFVEMANSNKGIFNIDNFDLELIQYQATTLNFFSEQLSLMTYSSNILTIIEAILKKDLNSSPAIITALIPLAYFLCTAIVIPHLSPFMHTSLVFYMLKIVLILISTAVKPNLYRYLSEDSMPLLERLIDRFSQATKNMSFDIASLLNSPTIKSKIGEDAYRIVRYLYEMFKTDPLIFGKIKDLLTFLLCNEYSVFSAFFNPTTKSTTGTNLINKYMVKPRNYYLANIIPLFGQIYSSSLPAICELLNVQDQIVPLIPSLLQIYPASARSIPLLVSKSDPAGLNFCETISPESSLCLLRPEILRNSGSSEYVEKCLGQFDTSSALLFIPQFVQALRFDSFGALQRFLLSFCRKSDSFTHFLLWNVASEKGKPEIDAAFQQSLVNLELNILTTMSTDEQQHYDNELQFINNISAISARLLPLPFDERKSALVDELSKLVFTSDLYVPSNPEYRILEIDASHSIPLKSHSRVPILVRFRAQKGVKTGLINRSGGGQNKDDEKSGKTFINCIFKIEDDVRMDALMIQLIDAIFNIIVESDIDCFLLPYRIYATGDKRGVIECIQNAKSRHDIGELTKSSLLKYFTAVYGPVGTPDFERAQNNFIKSMAPYSLICYLFQVKDRHNANIMIDDEGHVIHIDFGFIFDISPGGNMKFEKAPFKLSNEMVELLGNGASSPPFIHFAELFGKCFVAVRSRIDEIESIAFLMKDAGLPCFKNDSFKKLRERFFLDKPNTDLQENIYSLITSSVGAYTTAAYDAFQFAQNSIFYV